METTVADLVKIFLGWAEKNRAPRTVDFYRRYLERFAAEHGNLFPAQLKAHHLIAFSGSWHPMQAIQRCFAWCSDEAELIDRNPFKKVKRPALGYRKRILTPQEKARFLRGSLGAFRPFMLALRETMARPQEVRELRWEHIRINGEAQDLRAALLAGEACFYLLDFKGLKRRKDTSGVRIIPITPRLGRYLVRQLGAQAVGEGLIFKNSKGLPWTRNALRLRMRYLRDRLGVGPDLRGEKVVCYTMRHTQATEACALGVRDRILADLMGHSGTRMTARYQHLQPEHLQQAMKFLDHKRRNPPPQIL